MMENVSSPNRRWTKTEKSFGRWIRWGGMRFIELRSHCYYLFSQWNFVAVFLMNWFNIQFVSYRCRHDTMPMTTTSSIETKFQPKNRKCNCFRSTFRVDVYDVRFLCRDDKIGWRSRMFTLITWGSGWTVCFRMVFHMTECRFDSDDWNFSNESDRNRFVGFSFLSPSTDDMTSNEIPILFVISIKCHKQVLKTNLKKLKSFETWVWIEFEMKRLKS